MIVLQQTWFKMSYELLPTNLNEMILFSKTIPFSLTTMTLRICSLLKSTIPYFFMTLTFHFVRYLVRKKYTITEDLQKVNLSTNFLEYSIFMIVAMLITQRLRPPANQCLLCILPGHKLVGKKLKQHLKPDHNREKKITCIFSSSPIPDN